MTSALPLRSTPRWQREWREAITDPLELLRKLGLQELAARVFIPARDEFPVKVPLSFFKRMEYGNAQDPLLRQVLPLNEEKEIVAGYSADAVGDLLSRTAPGVIHKYSGRALLIATGSCAIHCRYCFRRHFPYSDETAAGNRWRDAVAYLRRRTDLDEVILSGGDPLSLATHKLRDLSEQLRGFRHIKRMRIHTRLPVVLPSRVDEELLQWLASLPIKPVIVIHANHGNELDEEVGQALARLRAAGAPLLNQSVLLKGVNDDLASLTELSEKLFDHGVLPYYLHVLDRVAGTAHFDVEESKAVTLFTGLQAELPGYLVPRLVKEIQGEASKTPL